ncbi:MAG: peptidylprolyl isomerase [Alphaproteobacteria bacterium]|nr:peptidylprolyl isomerase [Alphaproteobacteria bacterium]MBU6471169.1 peptidylprolyl isomerase [Alphaproteobacteria bacterium]MDE2013672.1 peptidylprolyl isomerase [Alphaproteobacteria bacterium]MDE2072704.1 peptidylprolyl isomerase [Alphaproteobacteria bacterium]MDE2350973.1 peptidylprolyl isomerase [Alphaproteobacteria bacterium]
MKRLALTTWIVAALLAVPLFHVAAASTNSADDAANWRQVDPANLLLIDTRYGRVAVELAPDFAPRHVARLRALARAHFYDGLSFYRVIDGFVAQGGIGEDADAAKYHPQRAKALGQWPPLQAEFDRPIADIPESFTSSGTPDLFAPEVGYVEGFAVGRDPKEGREWLIHCPGTFAFARDNAPDTASTEFYIVIGEAPRRLDRNLTAFGRVIAGMRYVQKLHRGDPKVDNGVIEDVKRRDPILRVRLAADLPAKDRPHYQVMRTGTPAFAAWMKARIDPAPGFYVRQPPKVLDVCLAPVPARLVR